MITELILKGLEGHLDQLVEENIALDQKFLSDLGRAICREALDQGLDPALAAYLLQTVEGPVALELGLS